MRERALLHIFLDRLHKAGALSVPPEDLLLAADETVMRFVASEQGGPGYKELQAILTTLDEMSRMQEGDSN